jgi:hypothetical protein
MGGQTTDNARGIGSTHERAFQIACSVLRNEIGILEGVRALLPLLHIDSGIASKDDLNLMIGIDSETDHLPLGKFRENWHPDFLPNKDREVARCQKLYGDQVRSACERILAKGT